MSRQLLPVDHQRLRDNIPSINRLGDLSIKWRRLGETGITLMERGEYEQATERPLSQLGKLSSASAASSVRQSLSLVDGARERLEAPTKNVAFMGGGPFLSIAYILDTEQAGVERAAVTGVIDELAGVGGTWGQFEPHVSVATIPRDNAADSILDAFWEIAPTNLTFLPPRTEVV